jgi:ribosome-associated translation inhibitor RaiA/cold shock CspA family protein
MQIPLQVSFRNLDYSPFVSLMVRERVERLEKFYPRITSVRVMIEYSARRHHQGNRFHVRLDITVPGREIVVCRDPRDRQTRENIRIAIREAFDAAKRQLEDHVRVHYRGKQRHHEVPSHGRVIRLFPNEECGFLEAEDGRSIFFTRNSVLNGAFDRLRIGDEVRFAEELGEQGPSAGTVCRVGKQGRHVRIA